MPDQSPQTGGVAKPCSHCAAALQVSAGGGEQPTVQTFVCPLCGWQNSVVANAITGLAATIECACARAFQIELDPQAARVTAAETQQLTAEGPVYERMTITRSIINCPGCKQPHFVFGKARLTRT